MLKTIVIGAVAVIAIAVAVPKMITAWEIQHNPALNNPTMIRFMNLPPDEQQRRLANMRKSLDGMREALCSSPNPPPNANCGR